MAKGVGGVTREWRHGVSKSFNMKLRDRIKVVVALTPNAKKPPGDPPSSRKRPREKTVSPSRMKKIARVQRLSPTPCSSPIKKTRIPSQRALFQDNPTDPSKVGISNPTDPPNEVFTEETIDLRKDNPTDPCKASIITGPSETPNLALTQKHVDLRKASQLAFLFWRSAEDVFPCAVPLSSLRSLLRGNGSPLKEQLFDEAVRDLPRSLKDRVLSHNARVRLLRDTSDSPSSFLAYHISNCTPETRQDAAALATVDLVAVLNDYFDVLLVLSPSLAFRYSFSKPSFFLMKASHLWVNLALMRLPAHLPTVGLQLVCIAMRYFAGDSPLPSDAFYDYLDRLFSRCPGLQKAVLALSISLGKTDRHLKGVWFESRKEVLEAVLEEAKKNLNGINFVSAVKFASLQDLECFIHNDQEFLSRNTTEEIAERAVRSYRDKMFEKWLFWRNNDEDNEEGETMGEGWEMIEMEQNQPEAVPNGLQQDLDALGRSGSSLEPPFPPMPSQYFRENADTKSAFPLMTLHYSPMSADTAPEILSNEYEFASSSGESSLMNLRPVASPYTSSDYTMTNGGLPNIEDVDDLFAEFDGWSEFTSTLM